MHRKTVRRWSMVVGLGLLLAACQSSDDPANNADTKSRTNTSPRPNFLIIVADDLGYSDIGVFGGEIDTPNLDRLAREGLRFARFYASPMCSTTRAMLLTGVDHHVVGYGNMPLYMRADQRGQPGYEGHLNERVATISSELLRMGYHTSIAGKWHLGKGENLSPAARGFRRSFVLEDAGGNHFNRNDFRPAYQANYRRDGKITDPPEQFYSSELFTTELIGFISEAIAEQRSFFSVLSFTAPHAPLQAPRSFIDKYRGRYDAGYAVTARRRLANLHTRGVFDKPLEEVRLKALQEDWDALSDAGKQSERRKMEVYAAMIDAMDKQIGRILSFAESKDVLRNTVVVFLSDNGASGIDRSNSERWQSWMHEMGLSNNLENIGSSTSSVFLGAEWASVSNTPFRLFKTFTTEGGIRTPAIIRMPNYDWPGTVTRAPVSVMDLAPTIVEMASQGQAGSAMYGGNVSHGHSLLPALNDLELWPNFYDATYAFELNGRRAVFFGPWKYLYSPAPFGTGDWELYHVDLDPFETHNVRSSNPDIAIRLDEAWHRYVDSNGVLITH
ncbi:MAG: arylsulfatase [Pseudomonadota bacterium]